MSSPKVEFLDYRTVRVSMGNKSKMGQVSSCQIAVSGIDNIDEYLKYEIYKAIKQLEREENANV